MEALLNQTSCFDGDFSKLCRFGQSPFNLKVGRYNVKIADSKDEFIQMLQLREEVFSGEYGASPSLLTHADNYDEHALSLVVKDGNLQKVVACYRMIPSNFSDNFYSEEEFCIDDFKSIDEKKIELSRACVAAEYRSGIILHLLWRGLAEYVKLFEVRYLFGLSSITSFDIRQIQEIYRYLNEGGYWTEELDISPKEKFAAINLGGFDFGKESKKVGKEIEIPPLLESYLKAGAVVHGAPAWDQEFNCIDLFTIIDLRSTAKSYFRKYLI